jgi:hypothetical protein
MYSFLIGLLTKDFLVSKAEYNISLLACSSSFFRSVVDLVRSFEKGHSESMELAAPSDDIICLHPHTSFESAIKNHIGEARSGKENKYIDYCWYPF